MFRTHQHFVVWAVASTFTKLDLPILSYSIIKLFRCGSEARCHRGVPSQSPPTWTSDPIDISCLASYQTQESQERPTMSTLTASSIYKDTVRNPPMVNTHQATNSKNKLQAIARGHTFLVWSVACLPLCACAFFFLRGYALWPHSHRHARCVWCDVHGRAEWGISGWRAAYPKCQNLNALNTQRKNRMSLVCKCQLFDNPVPSTFSISENKSLIE